MSGECETCGEHTLDCKCKNKIRMDQCDRYALHEMYKRRVKDMVTKFAYDLIIEIQKGDANKVSIKQIYDFCDEWVEKHIKPVEYEND